MGADQRDRPCTSDQVFQEGTVAQGIPMTPCTYPKAARTRPRASGLLPFTRTARGSDIVLCRARLPGPFEVRAIRCPKAARRNHEDHTPAVYPVRPVGERAEAARAPGGLVDNC